MEEALIEVFEYLFNVKGFNIIISEFYDGYLTTIKSNILENVGMKREAVLHERRINDKTGMSENEIIYSISKTK
jgi:hypothetical protein